MGTILSAKIVVYINVFGGLASYTGPFTKKFLCVSDPNQRTPKSLYRRPDF